ncbi:MAG: acetyl-CoA decarbonylase/synthase complex subunit delta, partial [Firmicutes bacterium]|nr:acetyl-CoA decarbonylase/synthase complex subunit delta [Bacillota bacterium]
MREIYLGGILVGGVQAFPLHTFDAAGPHPVRLGLEVWDVPPEDWSPELDLVLGQYYADTVAWARRAAEVGAEALYLRLKSADPHGAARPLSEVARGAQAVLEQVDLPAVVVGCGDPAVDQELLPLVAEALSGRRVVIGNAENDTYPVIAQAATRGGHGVVAYTPMDVSLAKQLNVLLTQAGVPDSDIL